MINAPRPSPFSVALSSSCITVNAKQKTNKNGVVLGMRLVYYSTVSYCDPPIYNAMINLISLNQQKKAVASKNGINP